MPSGATGAPLGRTIASSARPPSVAINPRRTRTGHHAANVSAAAAGFLATVRARCICNPKSPATAESQPVADASAKRPKSSADRRRAAPTVIANITPFAAASDPAR
ncbi:MAG: hypothetical protein QM736_04545 [Vicinamibacterales bacterium]